MDPCQNAVGFPQVVLPNADDAPASFAERAGHKTVAGFVAGMTKGFEAGDGADPGHEVGVGFELAEFAPGDEGGFLEDVVDVFPGGKEGAEEATESGFVSHEEANEGFVGFGGGRGGH